MSISTALEIDSGGDRSKTKKISLMLPAFITKIMPMEKKK